MIGYYIHHHGSGHLVRAHQIVAHLKGPVTGLSSLPRPDDWPGAWVQLAPDDTNSRSEDPTANGTLHWVPRHDQGLRTRTRQLVEWIDSCQPQLVVVDVSVEITALVRLCGTPVVVMAMPGDRDDDAHRLAYHMAEALIAPWPSGHNLGNFETEWAAKIHHVGAFSRFDCRPLPHTVARRPGPAHALLLWGTGGTERLEAMLNELRVATSPWSWSFAGPGNFLDDDALWRELSAADVVVTHAGQNALSDVAAAEKPAVVVSSPRPFDEQSHTARALNASGTAVGVEVWPTAERWSALLDEARHLGGHNWRRWSTGHGALDCAARLDEIAADLQGPRRRGGLSNA